MLTALFIQNLDIIFLVYGLAFLGMGIAIFIQPRRGSIFELANIIWILGAFGLIHGLHEWLEMITMIKGYHSKAWGLVLAVVLTSSFTFLFEFGRRLIILSLGKFLSKWSTILLSCIALVSIVILKGGQNIWPRYLLGFPGGALVAFAFILYYRNNETSLEPFGVERYFLAAAASTATYSISAGLIVPKALFFPARIINHDSFLSLFGIPVQVFRSLCAIFLTWSVWHILKIFNQEFKARLENSERLATMGRVSSIIGHEFRNQLGVIGTSVYFLKMKLQDADEKIKKHLEILTQQVSETNSIIEDILTFSRTREVKYETLEIGNLLAESIGKSKKSDGIIIVTRVDKELPKIKGDGILLIQAFENIISNAIEAMGEKGKLTITASMAKGCVEIIFQDTGPGIKEEIKKKIFTPFLTTRNEGIGLGLVICKGVIEAHGGSINIEGEAGKGTAVVIKLPLS